MFCPMGKIQDTHGIRPMPIGKGLQPVCPIHDGTDFLCLPHLAPLHLHFRQFSKGRSIG
jgi:hypothetical protein